MRLFFEPELFVSVLSPLHVRENGVRMSRSNTSLTQAKKALRESTLHALRNLVVEQVGQSLIISGRVASFYHKQMAQEIVRAVCTDIELKNTVDVNRRPET